MKVLALILFIVVYVECRKIYPQINKNANVDFINMESGGVRGRPAAVEPPKPGAPAPAPTTKAPAPAPAQPVAQPSPPVAKPVASPTVPVPAAKPAVPQKPAQPPQPIQPVQMQPVNPAPAGNPTTTPLPGSVKSLINYYDSKGNASPIRPYSYSQAVKQG